MPGSIRDQAIEWHDRLRDDPSPETRRAFERWRADRPEHGVEYDQQQRLIDQVARLGLRPAMPAPVPRRRWIAVGAGVTALAAALAAVIFLYLPAMRLVGPDTRAAIAQNPFGPTKSVSLKDGTIVLLAGLTTVEPQFDAVLRRVRMTGTGARFFTANDGRRPLTVEVGGVRVTATSGVFDIDLSGRTTRVTAIRGSVTVLPANAAPQSATIVNAGHSLQDDIRGVVAAPTDVLRRVTLIDADRLKLSDLLRIANALGDPPIALADPLLGERMVVGRFDIQDHRALARKLGLALDLDVTDDGTTIIFSMP